MTIGANVQCDFLLCRTGLYPITASTGNGNIIVFRMNILLHLFLTSTNKDGGFRRPIALNYIIGVGFLQQAPASDINAGRIWRNYGNIVDTDLPFSLCPPEISLFRKRNDGMRYAYKRWNDT